jgi:hypothetical protein
MSNELTKNETVQRDLLGRKIYPDTSDSAIHLISLGAGVQSSTMALMASRGLLPESNKVKGAIFADTGDEPKSVYKWLDWLETKLSFPVYRVQRGVISDDSLVIHTSKKTGNKYIKSLIPAFTLQPDGKKGLLGRKCTADYKVREILKKARELGGIKHGQKTIGVVQWIGISIDEAHRMKPSRVKWAKNVWPLIDAQMSRRHCLEWMKDNGYPEPPRSACVYCPFHSDAEWRRLKSEEPSEFERAVQFEKDLQLAASKQNALTGKPFLTRRCVPLDTIDFSENMPGYQQIDMFGNECEGLCGV